MCSSYSLQAFSNAVRCVLFAVGSCPCRGGLSFQREVVRLEVTASSVDNRTAPEYMSVSCPQCVIIRGSNTYGDGMERCCECPSLPSRVPDRSGKGGVTFSYAKRASSPAHRGNNVPGVNVHLLKPFRAWTSRNRTFAAAPKQKC